MKNTSRVLIVVVLVVGALLPGFVAQAKTPSTAGTWDVKCSSSEGFSANWRSDSFTKYGYTVTFTALNQFADEGYAPKADKYLATFAGYPVTNGNNLATSNVWFLIKADGSVDLELAWQNSNADTSWPTFRELGTLAAISEEMVSENNLIQLHEQLRKEYRMHDAKCPYEGSSSRWDF